MREQRLSEERETSIRGCKVCDKLVLKTLFIE